MKGLYWNTVTTQLRDSLDLLMQSPIFSEFRLVGGTSLSLQLGHRMSVDIDLFSDSTYGTINFSAIDLFLGAHFQYVDKSSSMMPGMGRAYFIGTDENNAIKLDLFHTDTFIQPATVKDDIRMATIEEIIAMKINIIMRGGRKKDFWDLHELMDKYSVTQMLVLHENRYPYGHEKETILNNFIDFSNADEDFEPICLRGKHWELIKLEISSALNLEFPDYYQ